MIDRAHELLPAPADQTSQLLYADAHPPLRVPGHRAEEPASLIVDNGPLEVNIDPQSRYGTVTNSSENSITDISPGGKVANVRFDDDRIQVDFSPITGKPQFVNLSPSRPGVLSTGVELDPRTGKATDVEEIDFHGARTFFKIDPVTGKATPESEPTTRR